MESTGQTVMGETTLKLPKLTPPARFRPPKSNLPQTPEERSEILQQVRAYIAEHQPVPPMPMEDIKVHADRLVASLGCDPVYRDFIGVLMNNEMWRDSLAAIPYERRLLLLPKCLRVESKCPAPFDEFGLLCKQCGLCSIQDLQNEAERLGYAVLVAEGSAIVMSLIQTGKIEAIVGVSCLSVLERAFPYMEAAAAPGVAIPLLQDDCIDTTVDLDWIWDYIHLTSEDKSLRLDLGALREEVDFCFTPASLALIMGEAQGQTEELAREWLMRAGKRWRPFLTASVVQSLVETSQDGWSEDLKRICVAVECFHKASLIHDDIEDEDDQRYGEQTLHASHGVAVALNVGDLLVGEGYRLIAATGLSPEQKAAMLQVAAEGHRQLCRGQGAELCWMRDPHPMKPVEVLEIFEVRLRQRLKSPFRWGRSLQGWICTKGCKARCMPTVRRWVLPIRSGMISPITVWEVRPTTWNKFAPTCLWPWLTKKPRDPIATPWRRPGNGSSMARFPIRMLNAFAASSRHWTDPSACWRPTRRKPSDRLLSSTTPASRVCFAA